MNRFIKKLITIYVLLAVAMVAQAQSFYAGMDIKSSSSTTVYGEFVTFSLEASYPVGVTVVRPTGTVQFMDPWGTNLGSPVNLSPLSATSSIASISISSLDVGDHYISASYSGDAYFFPFTSPNINIPHTVIKANTSVVIANVEFDNDQHVLSGLAIVSVTAPGGGTPTGNVEFYLDGVEFYLDGSSTPFDSSPLNSYGEATLATSGISFTFGNHTVSAKYAGDNRYNASAISSRVPFSVSNTLSFSDPSTIYKYYGDPDFALPPVTGIVGSGALNYRSDNPAVASVNVSTGQVKVVSVGETNMYVKQLASGNYPESSESAPVKVIVSRKPLTVTGITATKVYDGTNIFTNEQINITGAVINGIVGSDVITLSKAGVTGTFGPAAGTGQLQVSGSFTISGTNVSNYVLVQPTVMATIVSSSDNTVSDVVIDGKNVERNGDTFYYISPCGSSSVEVGVSTTDRYATVSINNVQQNPYRVSLPNYGENTISIIVTAQDGKSATYILKVYRSVPVEVAFYNRFPDVLTVPVDVEGIAGKITSVEWFHNGVRMDRDPAKGYLEMKETGVYYALLNGQYRTCEVIKSSSSSALTMSVYPNPVETNREITVSFNNLTDSVLRKDYVQLQLHGIDGRLLKTLPVTGNQLKVAVPTNSGVVVVKLITSSGNQELKLIVK